MNTRTTLQPLARSLLREQAGFQLHRGDQLALEEQLSQPLARHVLLLSKTPRLIQFASPEPLLQQAVSARDGADLQARNRGLALLKIGKNLALTPFSVRAYGSRRFSDSS